MHVAVPRCVLLVSGPVLTFSLVVGLATDYDVFLSLRILEFRQMGYDDTQSIKLGLAHTSDTIRIAGLIMVIAFG